ncbi:ABC transporter permease [Salinispirillum marinum]|uniref:ABC transporter permease n=2 Tax=Saccharospirillaceae TaxID=255527 RepID=A0ABV8BCI9_9GAMM
MNENTFDCQGFYESIGLGLHGYGCSIMTGAWLTIQLAFMALALALVLGLLTAIAKLSKNRVARGAATTYTTLIRGVPDLVLMLLIFYGGQIGLNNLLYWVGSQFDNPNLFVEIHQFTAGVVTIGFIFGAYMGESFRGAFLAVPKGQIEAGQAYGMSGVQVFTRILFPQMVRHALPSLGNNWMVLLKTTALVSIIGLQDMTLVASRASRTMNEPFAFFLPVAAIYLLLTAVSEIGMKLINKRFSRGVVSS